MKKGLTWFEFLVGGGITLSTPVAIWWWILKRYSAVEAGKYELIYWPEFIIVAVMVATSIKYISDLNEKL